ncbi:MAG: hypothetical protein OHK0029_08530 [Armatimonadaceae bacterium]
MQTKNIATVDDLYRVEGKAELVHGEIVQLMPTGRMPGYAADEIFVSLRIYVRVHRLPGLAVADNKGFVVNLPNRQSFSPDAAYYEGPRAGMRFFEGAPRFAVEVRSENDCGEAAERAMKEKRRDYFLAGTEVVWDVDVLAEGNLPVVRKYVTPNAEEPAAVFIRGTVADAEPAVLGWTMNTDDLFEE